MMMINGQAYDAYVNGSLHTPYEGGTSFQTHSRYHMTIYMTVGTFTFTAPETGAYTVTLSGGAGGDGLYDGNGGA